MSRGDKLRTWPASVNHDPVADLYNVRGLDGYQVFNPGVQEKRIAEQAWAAINQHFDWGKDA